MAFFFGKTFIKFGRGFSVVCCFGMVPCADLDGIMMLRTSLIKREASVKMVKALWIS